MPALAAASGYTSVAALTDSGGHSALVATQALTVVPVCPKQSNSLPGTTARAPPPLCDGM